MTLVAGIDSSTQSCKVVVVDADTGVIVREGRAAHPDGTEVDPRAWWAAFDSASNALLGDVAALSVGGQQHGMVVLDDDGEVVRPALLWNDGRSAAAARDLVYELGGRRAWAEAVGSVPVASFTVTKLRWLARHEPDAASRVRSCLLPHDWLTWRLRADRADKADPADATTDRGDASGTGYWSPRIGAYRHDLLEHAFGRRVDVPRVAEPAELVGRTRDGIALAAGTGDNMAAALGLGLAPGDVVVSLGTSGTVFASAERPSQDASGAVAGFADAQGRFLPLVCTLNAARVLTSTATMLGVDLAELDRLAVSAEPGSGGLVLLPYLDGERTPELPTASGSLHGLTRAAMTPANLARAAVEGMLCGLADGLEVLRATGVAVRRVLLIGGGAAAASVRAVVPSLLGVPVVVPQPGEYVAMGAARQAAWALSGAATPPRWPLALQAELDAGDVAAGQQVRAAYTAAREATYGSSTTGRQA
jgi:xylulokinase